MKKERLESTRPRSNTKFSGPTGTSPPTKVVALPTKPQIPTYAAASAAAGGAREAAGEAAANAAPNAAPNAAAAAASAEINDVADAAEANADLEAGSADSEDTYVIS